MKHLFISLLVFLFAAPLSAVINSENIKPNKQKQEVAVIFIGNSITYGALHKNPAQTAPPVIVSQLLKKELKTKVYWRNCGVSGATTYNFLPSSNFYFSNVEKAVKDIQALSNEPIIFSIMLGTNDSACTQTTGAPVSNANYRKNLLIIIQRLREIAPNAQFILNRPIWYSPNTYNSAMYLKEGLERMIGYTPVLRKIAQENEDVYMGDEDAFNFFKENYEKYLCPEDGNAGTFYLHPNEKGAVKLAQFWTKKIVQLIQGKC